MKRRTFPGFQTRNISAPFLKNISDFYYNISHSGEYASLAYGDEMVGVDIEKIKKTDMYIDRSMLWKVLRIGLPISLQFSLIAVSSMAVQRVVNAFGTIAVAAFTATSRIEQLVHSPYQTLQASLSTYCGQNFGAQKQDRVIDGYRKSLGIMAIITVVLVFVMQFLGAAITSLFVSEPEVIELGAIGLRITSYFYIMLGVIYVVRGILNGVGDAFFALLNGIIEVIGRFTIPVLLTSYLSFGVQGIWWSCGIVWAVSGATAWLRYLKYYNSVKNVI